MSREGSVLSHVGSKPTRNMKRGVTSRTTPFGSGNSPAIIIPPSSSSARKSRADSPAPKSGERQCPSRFRRAPDAWYGVHLESAKTIDDAVQAVLGHSPPNLTAREIGGLRGRRAAKRSLMGTRSLLAENQSTHSASCCTKKHIGEWSSLTMQNYPAILRLWGLLRRPDWTWTGLLLVLARGKRLAPVDWLCILWRQ